MGISLLLETPVPMNLCIDHLGQSSIYFFLGAKQISFDLSRQETIAIFGLGATAFTFIESLNHLLLEQTTNRPFGGFFLGQWNWELPSSRWSGN